MKQSMVKWVEAAGVRALKTFFQSLASGITVGMALSEISWKYILSVSAVAAIYSVCTSFAGLPEVKTEE